MLEVLVHLDRTEIPQDYVVMAIRWRGRPAAKDPQIVRSLASGSPGNFQTRFANSPVIRVPSVIVPWEPNYILFPHTAGFEAAVHWIEPLRFDERLLTMK